MQDLTVIGVENGALLAASDDGSRYRIPIDELMQAKLRQAIPSANAGRKMSPREIQSQIRSGLSAQDVSHLTGVPLEYITRFEGPVLAEREFVVSSALNVAVHTAAETDPFTHGMTFGSAIRHRLVALSAVNERWASWKEEGSGWVVKLSFTADQIEHDARWSFEPKKNSLAPLNNEAVALSQQGDTPSALIPRLRAVSGVNDEGDAQSSGKQEAPREFSDESDSSLADSAEPDLARFDSGAFDLAQHDSEHPEFSAREAALYRFAPRSESASDSGTKRGTDVSTSTASAGSATTRVAAHQTADLLDALRKRRGERESANYREDDDTVSLSELTYSADPTGSTASELAPSAPGSKGIRLVDVPLDKYLANQTPPKATAPQPTTPAKTARKGRTAMPSWDDIVFGARPDDLA